MMFQRAPPDVTGFGVTTWTPGLTRSSHVRMCFGFPSRRTKTTTERVTIPFHLFALQLRGTRPFWTSVVMSGASENATTSADRPAAAARLWSVEGPDDWVNETSLPAAVFWNAGMSFP